ncbi:MAG: ABC transporter ATP-binding protein [Alphaproteobacteria bacterium]
MTYLHAEEIRLAYGATPVLNGVDLAVARGELVALLGPSGCGKTTVLRVMAGLSRPDGGRVAVDGRDVTRLPPERRNMAMVFQSYALWPHMNVRRNIGYGLKLRGWSRPATAARVDELLALLKLDGLGERAVTALSGGQRQRVALGRALAVDPAVLLLDEPLSNLDARIRFELRHELRAVQQALGITALHVTHDKEEAMVMADRIAIVNHGRIEQIGAPDEVHDRPATAFVADFLGATNRCRVSVAAEAGGAMLRGEDIAPAPIAAPPATGDHVLFFRPTEGRLAPPHAEDTPAPGGLSLAGRVEQVSYTGDTYRHQVMCQGRRLIVDAADRWPVADAVRVHIPASALRLFAEASLPDHLRG